MKALTEKQLNKLTNLNAFNANFEMLSFRYNVNNKTIYVYNELPNNQESNYIQYGSLEYINGWLYGAVQAKFKMFKSVN